LGEELMTDLFPLCDEHHEEAHRLDRELADRGVQHQGLWGITKILTKQFESEARARLASRDVSLASVQHGSPHRIGGCAGDERSGASTRTEGSG
jgi:hypothetical protein